MLDEKDAAVTIKADAKEIIDRKLKGKKIILLALDDGSNKYSKQGGTCTVGTDYQLVGLTRPDPDFSVVVKNNAGYQMYTSKAELNYLDNGLVINKQGASNLTLSADSGLLDGGLQVNDFKPRKLSAKDYQGGESC